MDTRVVNESLTSLGCKEWRIRRVTREEIMKANPDKDDLQPRQTYKFRLSDIDNNGQE